MRNFQPMKQRKNGWWNIAFALKPFDSISILRPLFVDRNVPTPRNEPPQINVDEVTFVIRYADVIREHRTWLSIIPSASLETLKQQTLTIARRVLFGDTRISKRPLLRRLLRIRSAGPSILCIQPDYFFPIPAIAAHSIGQAKDQTQSEILGIINGPHGQEVLAVTDGKVAKFS